jgi:hypothetical protein
MNNQDPFDGLKFNSAAASTPSGSSDPFTELEFNPNRQPGQVMTPKAPASVQAPTVDNRSIDERIYGELTPAVTAGLQGFNKGFETLPGNIATGGAKAIDAILGTNAQPAVDQFYGNRAQAQQQDMAQAPMAGQVGEFLGGAGAATTAAAPTALIGGVPGAIAGGALGGAAATNPSANTADHILNAGIGAVTGGAISSIPGIFSWAKNFSTPETLKKATQVVQNRIGSGAGAQVAENVTPADPRKVALAVRKTAEKVEATKRNLYGERDKLAAAEGASVDFSGGQTKQLWAMLKEQSKTSIEARKAAKDLGNLFLDSGKYSKGTAVPYKVAQEKLDLASDLWAQSRFRAKQGAASKNETILLKQIKDTIAKDIQAAPKSETLTAAQMAADDFYKTNVMPMRSNTVKGLLEKGWTDEHFLNSLANTIPKYNIATKTLNVLAPEERATVASAYLDALQKSSVDRSGLAIDPIKFSNNLEKALGKSSAMFGNSIEDIKTLAQVVSNKIAKGQNLDTAKSGAMMGVVPGAIVGSAVGMPGVGSAIGASGGVLANFFKKGIAHSISNPATKLLLKQAASLGKNADKNLADALGNEIFKSFIKGGSSNIAPYLRNLNVDLPQTKNKNWDELSMNETVPVDGEDLSSKKYWATEMPTKELDLSPYPGDGTVAPEDLKPKQQTIYTG